MFESLSRSFALAKESFAVIQKDKEILLFPILSGIACILFVGALIIPFAITGLLYGESLNNPVIIYGGLFLFYHHHLYHLYL